MSNLPDMPITDPRDPNFNRAAYEAWQAAVEKAREKAIYEVTPNLARLRADVHTTNTVRAVIADKAVFLKLGLVDKFIATIARLTEKARTARDPRERAATQAELIGLREMAVTLNIDISDANLRAALEKHYREAHIRPIPQVTRNNIAIDIKDFVEKVDGEHAAYGSKAFSAYVKKHHPARAKALLEHAEWFFGYDDIISIVLNSFEGVFQPSLHDPMKFFDETVNMALARQREHFSIQDYKIIRDYTEQFRAYVKRDVMHIKSTEPAMSEIPLKPNPKNPAWEAAVDAAYGQADRAMETSPSARAIINPHRKTNVKSLVQGARQYLKMGMTEHFRTMLEKGLKELQQNPNDPELAYKVIGLRTLAEQLHISVPTPTIAPEKAMAGTIPKSDANNPAWIKAVDAAYEKATLEIAPNLSAVREPHDVPSIKFVISQGRDFLRQADIRGFTEHLAKSVDGSRNKRDPLSSIEVLGLRSMVAQLHIEINNNDLAKAMEAIHEKEKMNLVIDTHRFDIRHDMSELARIYGQEDPPFGNKEYVRNILARYPGKEGYLKTGFPMAKTYGGIQGHAARRLRFAFNPQVHNAVEFFDESVNLALKEVGSEVRANNFVSAEQLADITKSIEQWRAYVKHDVLGVRTPEEVKTAMNQAVKEVLAEVTSGRPGAPAVDPDSLYPLASRLRMRALDFKERYDPGRYFTEGEDGNIGKNGTAIRARGDLQVALNHILKRYGDILDVEIKGIRAPSGRRTYRPLGSEALSPEHDLPYFQNYGKPNNGALEPGIDLTRLPPAEMISPGETLTAPPPVAKPAAEIDPETARPRVAPPNRPTGRRGVPMKPR